MNRFWLLLGSILAYVVIPASGPVDDIANGLLAGLLAVGVAGVLLCALVILAVQILR